MKKKYFFKIFGLSKIMAEKVAKPKLLAGQFVNKSINALMIFLSYLFILILVITIIKDLFKLISPRAREKISIMSLDSGNFSTSDVFDDFKNPDYKISYKSFKKEPDLLRNSAENDIIIISSEDFSFLQKNNILVPIDEELKNRALEMNNENSSAIFEVSNRFISICEEESNKKASEEELQEREYFCQNNQIQSVCNKSKKYTMVGQLRYQKNKEMLTVIRYLKNNCNKIKALEKSK